jgi:glycolate dehydrogenase FAD-binding subunit
MQNRFKPETAAQVLEVISWAMASNKRLEIQGAGSKQGIGNLLECDATLSLSGLTGISLYEPEELILTAAAGTPLREIEAVLAEKNQELAFEPADFGPLLGGAETRATIGGVFAANISGPRRLKAGAARDHFLGLKAISGRAEEFRSGGRVVKNVTGYDLCKGLAGSWGTLAVLSEVTVKVLPAAEQVTTLILAGLDDEQAMQVMSMAMNSACEVSGAAHVPVELSVRSSLKEVAKSGASATLLRLEGIGPSVEYRARQLETLLGKFGNIIKINSPVGVWRDIRDVRYFANDQEKAVWRLSVPPRQGASVTSAIAAEIEGAEFYYDWAGGLIWLAVPEQSNASQKTIRKHLETSKGHATLIRASSDTRSIADVFQPLDQGLMGLTKNLKHNFDPSGVLNPGRMYRNL